MKNTFILALAFIQNSALAQTKLDNLLSPFANRTIFDDKLDFGHRVSYGHSGDFYETIDLPTKESQVLAQRNCSEIFNSQIVSKFQNFAKECKSLSYATSFEKGYIDTLVHTGQWRDSDNYCHSYRPSGYAESGYRISLKVSCERWSVEERMLIPAAMRCEELLKGIANEQYRLEFEANQCERVLGQWEALGFPLFEFKNPHIVCPANLPKFELRDQKRTNDSC